jgi:hypothetical protein
MDYVSALLPPFVMAVLFIAVIRVIVKTQGGSNKAKEDAAVDAALARADSCVFRVVRPFRSASSGFSGYRAELCLAPWENSKTRS